MGRTIPETDPSLNEYAALGQPPAFSPIHSLPMLDFTSYMTPVLNWRELASLTEKLKAELIGTFVDRIIVPDRPQFKAGYIKGEWAIRLTSRKLERVFLFSIRARQPYLAVCQGKGPKAAQQGTHSVFDLALSKHLKGAKVQDLEALSQERVVILWFSPETLDGGAERFGLILSLIPAMPEALLVRVPVGKAKSEAQGWPILARSRNKPENKQDPSSYMYFPPDGSRAPQDLKIREELIADAETFYRTLELELQKEAFEQRLRSAEKLIRDALKQSSVRARQNEVAYNEAQAEPDWQHYGDLFKNSMTELPPLVIEKTAKGSTLQTRRLYDFKREEFASVPCDPKLNPQAQVEKFYQMSRRKVRRISESKSRLDQFLESSSRFERLLKAPPLFDDWKGLEKLERSAGIVNTPAHSPGSSPKQKASAALWPGKFFVSRDKVGIWVGRDKDENLELTFKRARGNDIWMHVRGKPGAHAIIPTQSGKSVPLDTLLDAATLVVYYSNGEKWGKTEVDYTFKKYVKRIRDSIEVTYSNNKTLIIEPDPTRLKRLLDEAGPLTPQNA